MSPPAQYGHRPEPLREDKALKMGLAQRAGVCGTGVYGHECVAQECVECVGMSVWACVTISTGVCGLVLLSAH